MKLLKLLTTGASQLGYNGNPVPSTVNLNKLNPGFTRHNQFSINRNPNIADQIIVGGVPGLNATPVIYTPSRLEETDPFNTSLWRSDKGQKYTDTFTPLT